ncbi:GNAT family N-acetyltransferase, partial [Listeria monocytogenes]
MKTIFQIGVWHMIRKLTVSDNEEVMALLKPEAIFNL